MRTLPGNQTTIDVIIGQPVTSLYVLQITLLIGSCLVTWFLSQTKHSYHGPSTAVDLYLALSHEEHVRSTRPEATGVRGRCKGADPDTLRIYSGQACLNRDRTALCIGKEQLSRTQGGLSFNYLVAILKFTFMAH